MAEVLTLSTGKIRNTVKIDGEDYSLRTPEEISVASRVVILTAAKGIEKSLDDSKELTEEDGKKVSEALKAAMNVLFLDIPDAVENLLTDSQRIAIVGAFIQAPGKESPVPEGQKK